MMVQPLIVPRAEHAISRRDIDPDALKVLYRLHQFGYVAYLVGGSVRDLLLNRRPKDFDIGTSAHPYQIKRLFRNCWIIGRRFRLAHVKFGAKTIEVATFRRMVPVGSEEEPPRESMLAAEPDGPAPGAGGRAGLAPHDRDRLIHRDNTFGTPEEDAFRRDFTVNALFYDIATFSIIDYVGGLADLAAGVIRSIGDPNERFQEDPVRMVRAIALSGRLGFTIDPPIFDAIARHRDAIRHAAPARLLEEYYKILRAGAAEAAFRCLAETGLLERISPELAEGQSDRLWQSFGRLDAYRRRFSSTPEALTTPILLGTLLVPLGYSDRRVPRERRDAARRGFDAHAALGSLPLARRDLEQLRQILALQPRLLDLRASHRVHRALAHRGAFREAVTWLEIHGDAPDAVQHWHDLIGSVPPSAEEAQPPPTPRRRRRRRRRRSPRSFQ